MVGACILQKRGQGVKREGGWGVLRVWASLGIFSDVLIRYCNTYSVVLRGYGVGIGGCGDGGGTGREYEQIKDGSRRLEGRVGCTGLDAWCLRVR